MERTTRAMKFFPFPPLPLSALSSQGAIFCFGIEKKEQKNIKKNNPEQCSLEPGSQEKDTKPVPPCPKDYDTSVAEMPLPLLLRSTLTDDTHASTVTQKNCLFCDWKYFFRPSCGSTWGLKGRTALRAMCSGANHIQSTLSVMHAQIVMS